jgi:predicted porin
MGFLMKMGTFAKLTVAAAVASLGAQAAMAQSSVTMYGILDTGVEFLTHANANGDSLVRVPKITGTIPSRWGIRGREDLGGGYAAIFTLEDGFNVGNGAVNQGGRLFGRQAFVGIDSPYGQFTFGRQYTMTNPVGSDANIMGPAMYAVASTDSYLPNARTDNTIAYKGKFEGLTFGATYSFARDSGSSAGSGNSPGEGTCVGGAGAGIGCTAWSAMLKYDKHSAYGVAASYELQHGGTGALANLYNGLPAIDLSHASDEDIRINANGYVFVGPVKLGAGWLGRRVLTQAQRVTVDTYYLAAQYWITPALELEGTVFRVINNQMDTRATALAALAAYHLSKRTEVYVQTGYLTNSKHGQYTISSGGGGSTPGAGMGQLGLMLGVRQNF